MSVMIPVDNSMDIGIRPVISANEVDAVFLVLRAETSQMSCNWNKRQRENLDKLKSGDIMEVAEVVRNLIRAGPLKETVYRREKRLTNAEQF